MIASNYFGHPGLGRNLGNHLFELASMVGLARRYDTELRIPPYWQYAPAFVLSPFVGRREQPSYVFIREPKFSCCLSFFDRFAQLIRTENVSIEGYLQSEKYWKAAEEEVRSILTFNDSIRGNAQKLLCDKAIDPSRFVAISVRRGDFATDPGHYLLPYEYYVGGYKKHFATKNIFLFSDNIAWCRAHFEGLAERVVYAEGMNAIEQLATMSLFENFIIANSTFSWWGAYLSACKGKTVVRPCHHFDGPLLHNYISDHYPQEWMVYGHLSTPAP